MARALRRDRLGLPAKQVGRAHVLLQQGSVCARVRATQYKQTSAFYGSAQKSVHGLVVWSRQGTAARAQEKSGSKGGKAPSKAPFQERSFGFQERILPKLLSSLVSLFGSSLQLPSSARFCLITSLALITSFALTTSLALIVSLTLITSLPLITSLTLRSRPSPSDHVPPRSPCVPVSRPSRRRAAYPADGPAGCRRLLHRRAPRRRPVLTDQRIRLLCLLQHLNSALRYSIGRFA